MPSPLRTLWVYSVAILSLAGAPARAQNASAPRVELPHTGQLFQGPPIQVNIFSPVNALSIEVFANGVSVSKGQSSSGLTEFQTTWRNVSAGEYTLTAVATDLSQMSRTSNPVVIHVTAEPIPHMAFQLTFDGVGPTA